ncbi:MAG: hypothetical protein DWQ04_26310 [Chloroflexi bacterium]|nr:MAG: hypothetical protein DWQ04_26310 [Chloroflexota bacterium]
MNLFDFSFLTDENIHPEVVVFLRKRRVGVQTVSEIGLIGQPDAAVLQFAQQNQLVVLTHDSDFGTLAIARQQPIIGILFLRPEHILPEFTIATIEALVTSELEVDVPFIVTAVRKGIKVRTRVRFLGTSS